MAQGNCKVSRATDHAAQRRFEGSKVGSGALSDAKILALKAPIAGQLEFAAHVRDIENVTKGKNDGF